MTILCAWCGLNMGQKEPVQDRRVSHGMCPECEEKQLAEDAKEDSK